MSKVKEHKYFEDMSLTEQADDVLNDMRGTKGSRTINLWDLGHFFECKDREYLAVIFPDERQLKFISGLISLIDEAFKFHETFEESHDKTILKDLNKLQAQFRNHRHDFSKQYTGKCEY